MAGFKGRIARMLLNFLDEHGNYRESLEEAAARAAAAEANSLLARDRRARKKGRRSSSSSRAAALVDDDDDDYWGEEEELPKLSSSSANTNNNLPEDPYEQIQFYIQTFKSRTITQLHSQFQSYQLSTTNWLHEELHYTPHVTTTSFLLFSLTAVFYLVRKRSKIYTKYQRIHSILGQPFLWKTYLHSNYIRGTICYQLSVTSIPILLKLQKKAQKVEEIAISSMKTYQRKRYERFVTLEYWGDTIVNWILIVGMVLSGMTFGMSLYNLVLVRYYHHDDGNDGGSKTATTATDGYIYSLEGETDSDGYPLHLRELAEQRYAECIITAEVGGNDPREVCDLNSFFWGGDGNDSSSGSTVVRMKINALLNYIGIPSVLATYLTTLPTQTVAYLSSLFTTCLFVLSHYIAHKIHVLTLLNDPMKHFVVVDKTIKADGTVEAKRGETEAQRKKRERMLQAERYKAQMAQLAYEAKSKAQARIARLEGMEAAKREEEEKEKKIVEEQDETVRMYGRQFMMIKAGVPDGAIMNSFLPMGVEEEEGREILVKLHAIKERRLADAKKVEEEEAKTAEEEKKAEEMKERIVADRLKKMKSGKLPSSSGVGPPSMGLPSSSSTTTTTAAAAAATTTTVAQKGRNKLVYTEVEEAKRTDETMKGRILAASAINGPERVLGLKVAQPWASPGKKERRGVKNKRWDKVTKSWVDRDLETKGGDSVPIAVVLKDDGGDKEDMEEQVEEFKQTAHKVAEECVQSPTLPTKKAVNLAEPRASMISPSPDQSKVRSEFKTFVPSHSSPSRISIDNKMDSAGRSANPNIIKATETKYDAQKFNPISPRDERINTEKSEETKVTSQASSQSSSPPPVLLRVTESPDDDVFASQAFNDNPSAWSRRSSARDIKAMIEAVEAAPDDEAEDLFLGPTSLRTPAFEAAMRASNSSWDKRPSSQDIIAKIRAAEQQEANTEEDKALRRSTKSKGRMLRIDEGKNMVKQMRSKDEIDSKIGTSLLKKTRSQGGINSDDEISEISMVDELSITSATFASPKQLKKQSARMTESELSKISKLGAIDKSDAAKAKDEGSEAGTDVTSKNSAIKSEPKEETEEEKLRKKKADERAKKFEEMNARRRKGKGEDDGTAVSGISRRQRIRRKRSALAAIIPDEKKRDDWKKGIFAAVLNVEQEKWKKSVYAHVINAEKTRVSNIKAQEELEELNAAAQRRTENQKRLEAKAKKFAARAEKFHKLRHGDDGSVVSSASRMRRRRTRKADVDTPPRKSAASSSGAASVDENHPVTLQSQTESIVEEKDAAQIENDISQKSASKEQDATDAKDTGKSIEFIKEGANAETEQKDEYTVGSPNQREDTTKDTERDIDFEEKNVAENSVEEVNAALNSANIEQVAAEEIASLIAKQNEKNDNNQLDDGEITGINVHASYNDTVLNQLESEEGGEADNHEEKKTEPESEKPTPKSPISALKNMGKRRKASANKKKKKSK